MQFKPDTRLSDSPLHMLSISVVRGGDGLIPTVSAPLEVTQPLVRPFLWALVGPFLWVLVGPVPTKRSETCSERSDEARGCTVYIAKPTKTNITQTEAHTSLT